MLPKSSYTSVAVVGLGTIGTGWATFFLAKGLEVKVFDADQAALEEGLTSIRSNLAFLAQRGLARFHDPGKMLHVVTGLEELPPDIQYVQEAVYESYEVKRRVFAELDTMLAPEVVIASSSSGLLMTEIQKGLKNPERCLIAHPINPVHLVPLVEVVPGQRTAGWAVEVTRKFLEGLGKVTVLVRREVPGYIENRLTAALWREAIDLVVKGVATVEDVDKTIWAGPGLRYALMGPHLIYHLGGGRGGIRHFAEHLREAFRSWWEDMSTWTDFPEGAVSRLEEGIKEELRGRTFEEMASWRDEKLSELVKLFHREPGK